MTDTTAQTTTEGQKPIGEILDGGRQASEQAAPPPAATTADTADAGDTPEAGNRNGYVPINALHSERQRRKAETETRKRYQQQLAEAEQRLQEMEAAQQQQQPQQQDTDFWAVPFDQRFHELRTDLTMRTSVAEFKAEHGKDTFKAMINSIQQLRAANHPDLPVVAEMCERSPDPVGTLYEWWQENGGDRVLAEMNRPRDAYGRSMDASAFPSNLAGARNVGSRTGPAWSGPEPIGDILARGRQPRDIFKR